MHFGKFYTQFKIQAKVAVVHYIFFSYPSDLEQALICLSCLCFLAIQFGILRVILFLTASFSGQVHNRCGIYAFLWDTQNPFQVSNPFWFPY